MYTDNERKIRQKISGSLNKMKNALTVAILVVCLKTGSGLLNQKPQDSVTIAGKSTYFNCSTSEPSKPILWYHYATNEVHRETIYQFANFTDYWYPCYRKGRYVVEKNPATGAYNLVISMVLLSDAGRYLCEVEGDEGVATLTVQVESSPVCVASEICKPYIKSYSAAIICTILIVLPIAIGGTILVLWYLRVYRQKKRKQEVNNEADAKEQMTNIKASSQEETEQLMCATKDQTTKTQEHENELKHKDLKVNTHEDQLQKQLHVDEMQKLQEKNKISDTKIRQLKATEKEIEQRLYPAENINYAEEPTFQKAASIEQRDPISGMTILGNELFVSHENNSVMDVYDSDEFKFGRTLVIDIMSHPMDIASCKTANCIYIIFLEDNESQSHIRKLDPKGKPLNQWLTGGERGRLSTYESNVIVCLFEKQMINEFNRNGELIITVLLSSSGGINHPWHAIKINSSHFAVCHGHAKDKLHRVCIVDIQGRVVKELRDWKSKQKDGKLNVPICLAEGSEGSILVAERDSKAIRLLNCHLKLQMNLIKHENLEGHPVRICLDETRRQLYVATNNLGMKECNNGRIVKFNIRQYCQ